MWVCPSGTLEPLTMLAFTRPCTAEFCRAYLRPGAKKCYPILDLTYPFLHTTHTCKIDIGHTWYEETPHSKPKKAEPQQKLLEFPVIMLSNKVLIIIIIIIIIIIRST